MAFSYKNPLEQALNKLPSRFGDQILSSTSDEINGKVEECNSLFSYVIKNEVSELLSVKGIQLAPVSFKSHSHPASKMIENHILFIVMPNLVKMYKSVAFFSLRESKTNRFLKMYQALSYGKVKSFGMFNAIIDSKDKLRYGETELSSLGDRVQKLKEECSKADRYPKILMFHDELHHLGVEDVVSLFEEMPEIRFVIGTSIFPIEILKGENKSKEPRIYSIEVNRSEDWFYYAPDGCFSEGYKQSISAGSWPFMNNCICKGGMVLRVERVYSLFAHHVFTFERVNEVIPRDVIFFDKPSALLSEEIKIITDNFDECVFERSTMMSICTYLSCLKTPNAASAIAKLRQLEKRDLLNDELHFIYSLSSELARLGLYKDIEKHGLFQWTFEKMVGTPLNWVSSIFLGGDKVFQIKMRKMLAEMSNKHLIFERRPYRISRSIIARLPNFQLPKKKVETAYSMAGGLEVEKVNFRNLPLEHPNRNLIIGLKRGKRVPLGMFGNSVGLITYIDKGKEPAGESKISEEKLFHGESCTPSNDVGPSTGILPIDVLMSINKPQSSIKAQRCERKNSCVFDAFSKAMGRETIDVLDELLSSDISDELFRAIEEDRGLSMFLIEEVAIMFDYNVFWTANRQEFHRLNSDGSKRIYLEIRENHCELANVAIFKNFINNTEITPRRRIDLPRVDLPVNFHDGYKLMASMARGTTGAMSSFDEGFLKEMTSLLKDIECVSLPFSVKMRLGFAGSGKSKMVLDYIKSTPNVRRLFVSPRRNLADSVRGELKGTATCVMTFEVALKNATPGFQEIFLDEASLYPPGYLAAMIACIKRKEIEAFDSRNRVKRAQCMSISSIDVCLIGDPLQMSYYSDLDSMILSKENDLQRAIKLGNFDYLWQCYRTGSWFSDLVEIPTKVDGTKFKPKFHSDLSSVNKADFDMILCASQDEKSLFAGSCGIMTYGESQGLTFNKKTLIVLSHGTIKCSPMAILVAITRSRVGFEFLLNGIESKDVLRLTAKSLLSFVVSGQRIPKDRICNLIPNAVMKTELLVGSLQEKAANDPFILPFVNLAEEPEIDGEVEGEFTEAPEWFKTHIPVFDSNPLINEIFERMEEKEKREFRSMGTQSNQFYDLEKGLSREEVYPFQFRSIFPTHQADDDETFFRGVKKRIKFSSCLRERKKLDDLGDIGKKLCDEFLNHLPHRMEINEDDVIKGSISFDKKRSEKSGSLWENHKERSDIDWPLDRIFLFMKSQICTKEGKMFTAAKPGQTLACFHHIILFKFGPMLRAIENAFIRAIGESYYVHSMKNFFALDAFVTKNWGVFDGESLESDYEAFDSSQDHVVLAFELELLRRIGVCKNWIDDYKTMKLTLGCKLGQMAIMRFTGEFCTFLFNTFSNMLFTFLKYDVDHRKHRILFAGDDMASLSKLKKRGDTKSIMEKFSLKAVEEVKKYPMFCGWVLSPFGIVKSPRLLWARICLMEQRSLLHTCVDNYLFEAFFAYRLSERLYGILKEEEVEYHHLVTRFFIKRSSILKGSSRDLLKEIGEAIGCRSSESTISWSMSAVKESKLMLLNQVKYTAMQRSCTQKHWTQSGGLSQISKSWRAVLEQSCLQTLNSSTTRRLPGLSQKEKISTTFILGQLSDQSLQCFQTMKSLGEKLQYTTDIALNQSIQSLQRLNLTSRKDRLISYLGQNMFCHPLMRTYLEEFVSKSLSIARSIPRTVKYLHSTLDACIGWRTLQDFSKMHMVRLVGRLKQFKDVNLSRVLTRSSILLRSALSQSSCLMRVMWMSVQRGLLFCLREALEGGLTGLKRSWTSILSLLGAILRKVWDFIKRILKGMAEGVRQRSGLVFGSVQQVIKQEKRDRLMMFFWNRSVDPNHEIVPNAQMVQNGQEVIPRCNDQNWIRIKTASRAFLKVLFGNIALLGTSPNTAYPNIDVAITPFTMIIGEGQVVKNWTINLYRDVSAMTEYIRTLDVPYLKDMTLRQMCEPFADDAMSFLRDAQRDGIFTNIYLKWPKALSKAPHCAFDFAGGLSMSVLTDLEKGVIDTMTRRLFRTEGQKGVFASGSETQVELEG